MTNRFVYFINTRFQPGVTRKVEPEPFHRLFAEIKTVKTVFCVFRWLHWAEARC
jgi:hypothetical protein